MFSDPINFGKKISEKYTFTYVFTFRHYSARYVWAPLSKFQFQTKNKVIR